MNRFGIATVISIAGFALLASQAPSEAQYGRSNTGATRRYDPRKAKKQDKEYSFVKMDRPVSLPSLPQFTGKQFFVNGMSYPNNKSGPGWIQTYNCENPKEEIKSWWANALRMHQWKITFTDATTVKGQLKDGSTCSITIASPINTDKKKMKNCRASYSVYYHQMKKRR